jgi:hypothetical protein
MVGSRIAGSWARLRAPCTLAACAGILFARMPDRFTNPQFFAEDAFFYQHALWSGFRSILMPYGGYLLVAPRLVAWLGLGFSPANIPAFFNAMAIAFALVSIGRIFSPRVPLPYKSLVALSIVLVPHVEDVFMVMENIQWILSIALALLLISGDPRSPAEWIHDSGTAILGGLTGVFSILFFPFFLWRTLRRRTRGSLVLAGIIGAAGIVQCYFVIHGATPLKGSSPVRFEPGLIASIAGYRLVSQLFGGRWLLDLSAAPLGMMGFPAVAAMIAMLGDPRRNAGDRSHWRCLCGLAVVVAAASIYRFSEMLPMLISPEHLGRYFFILQVVFIWLVISELSFAGWRRWVSASLLSAYLATSVLFFRLEPLADCHWKDYAPLVRNGREYSVPLNPPGWFLRSSGTGYFPPRSP